MMRRITLVMVVGVLAVSGAYALIYLFRWEWHRAIITALFFVAAEVGLGIAVLLRRLTRLQQRLDELARPGGPHDRVLDLSHLDAAAYDPAVLARIREAAPPARSPFAWLDPQGNEVSVFLPFLLGVGALASGLAWVVEQIARHSTTPALEHRLARQLAPLAIPAGGLIGVASPPDAPVAARRGVRSLARTIAMTTLILGPLMAGTDWLGDSLQTRPDERRAGVSTRIDVDLRGARSVARPEQAAATLWGTCSHVLRGAVGPTTIRHLGDGHMELIVPTHIGTHAEARVRGCLEDSVVDRIQATVLALEAVPDG